MWSSGSIVVQLYKVIDGWLEEPLRCASSGPSGGGRGGVLTLPATPALPSDLLFFVVFFFSRVWRIRVRGRRFVTRDVVCFSGGTVQESPVPGEELGLA